MIAPTYYPALVVAEVVESPCPTFMGMISRESSSEQHVKAFLRESVSSLLDSAEADPQNAVGAKFC